MELQNKTPSPHPILQTLTNRGWCFAKTEQLHALITIHSALTDDDNFSTLTNSLEPDLLNTDLRSIGGKSLPDPLSLRKLSHLQGPKVLQVVAVRDIAVSSVEGFNSGSSHRRVLRLGLTDGHVEVTAIEYSRLSDIDIDGVVPGTKVRLENRVPVHSGIVCLGPKSITVIGGVVESLYEEWKMNKMYAGMSRTSLRVSQEADGGGPPPFEKLQIGAPIRRAAQRATHSEYAEPMLVSSSKNVPEAAANSYTRMLHTKFKLDKIEGERAMDTRKHLEKKESNSKARSREVALYVPIQKRANAQKHLQKTSQPNQVDGYSGQMYKAKGKLEDSQASTLVKEIDPLESPCQDSVPISMESAGTFEIRTFDRQQNGKDMNDAVSANSHEQSIEQKTSTSETRQKEVAESVPVQNRAATQKLLHKMSQSDQALRHSRGWRPRGRFKQEKQKFITLDEWERRKSGTKDAMKNEISDATLDEDIALQLQHQLDVEDSHAQRGKPNTVADDIRMSVFSYGRESDGYYGMEHGGRGRGRGKGRGRGRGGGKGRGRERRY